MGPLTKVTRCPTPSGLVMLVLVGRSRKLFGPPRESYLTRIWPQTGYCQAG